MESKQGQSGSLDKTQSSTALKKCPANEFNHYEEVTIYFYKQRGADIEFLLYSNDSGIEYKTVSGDFHNIDATVTFTAARLVLEQTFGCMSSAVQEKALAKQGFVREDLIFPHELIVLDVWKSQHFMDLLKHITACQCQLDDYEGKIVYFIKIDGFETEAVNETLKQLQISLSFKWVTSEELKHTVDSTATTAISKNILNLSQIVDLKNHIIDTDRYHQQEMSQKNIYIFLLFKPVRRDLEKSTVDIFYEHLSALFMGIYKRNKETWLIYNSARDEFPPEDALKHAKALIVPGSPVSVYDQEDWSTKGKQWLLDWYRTHKQTKYFGVCYGEQLISYILGGKVEPMEGRKNNKNYFLSINEKVELSPELFNLDFMKQNKSVFPKTLRVIEAHGDEVTQPPEGFTVLGGSESCKVEIIASEDQRVFGIQGHPEYTAEYVAARRVIVFAYMKKIELTKEYFEESYNEWLPKFTCADHSFLHRKMCYDFVKQGR